MTSDIVILLMKGYNATFEYVPKVILKISDNNIITFLIETCGDSLFGSEQWVIYNQTHKLGSVALKQLKWKDLLILD